MQARNDLASHSQDAASISRNKLRKAVDDCFNHEFPGSTYIPKVMGLLDSSERDLGGASQNVLDSYDYYVAKVKIARAKAVAAAGTNSGQRLDFDALAQQDADVIAAASAFLAKIPPAKQNVNTVLALITKHNENLSADGFVTSDKMSGAAYKYPNCNSQKNDRPGESWTSFKRAAFSIPADMDRLKTGVECQKTSVGGLENVNRTNGINSGSLPRR